jgi:hypothetical protein
LRRCTFELVTDTSHFTALQLQPRALLQVSFNALSRWLKEHLISFPWLIREHRLSVVILGARIRYERLFGFFDSDSVQVEGGCRVMRGGTRLRFDVEVWAPAGLAATVSILLCPVAIEDPLTLAATPTTIADDVLERFAADEVDPGSPDRTLPGLRQTIESEGTLVAEGSSSFLVDRHLCEVADQWAFTEVPALVGASSATIARERCDQRPELRHVLALPLRSFEMELMRPYFWFQAGQIRSRVYQQEHGMAVVHQLLSDVPGEPTHGIAIEEF